MRDVKEAISYLNLNAISVMSVILLCSALILGLLSMRVSAQDCNADSLLDTLNSGECTPTEEPKGEQTEEPSVLEEQSNKTTPEATDGIDSAPVESEPSEEDATELRTLIEQIEGTPGDSNGDRENTPTVAPTTPTPQETTPKAANIPADAPLPSTGPAQDALVLGGITAALLSIRSYFASKRELSNLF